jgi:hypothetical protein
MRRTAPSDSPSVTGTASFSKLFVLENTHFVWRYPNPFLPPGMGCPANFRNFCPYLTFATKTSMQSQSHPNELIYRNVLGRMFSIDAFSVHQNGQHANRGAIKIAQKCIVGVTMTHISKRSPLCAKSLQVTHHVHHWTAVSFFHVVTMRT